MLEIIQRIQQVASQRADRVHPVGESGLLLGAVLLEIGELGANPESLVVQLVAFFRTQRFRGKPTSVSPVDGNTFA